MAFDFGFDFRATSGYVTDPPYASAVLGESYPHTYTNANGLSIVGGNQTGGLGTLDLNSANDPRLAGDHYGTSGNATNANTLYRFDLPNAGQWSIQLAAGSGQNQEAQFITIYDNYTTVLLVLSDILTSPNNFMDPTGTVYTAANWVTSQTPVIFTFATTTFVIQIGPGSANSPASGPYFSTLAHLRLTALPTPAGQITQQGPHYGASNKWVNASRVTIG